MAIYITVNLKDGRTFDVPKPEEGKASSKDKFVLGAYAHVKRQYPNWSSMVITVVNDDLNLQIRGAQDE
jgi:hypothetical protein